MNQLRLLLASAALLASTLPAALGLTVPVVQDSFTASGKPTVLSAANGKAPLLSVSSNQTAFVRFPFDQAAVPLNIDATNLASANLRIYLGNVTQPGTLTIHSINTEWSETGGTAPTYDAVPLATVALTVANKKNFIIVDVTAAASNALQSGTFTGFALVGSNGLKALVGAKEGPAPSCELNLEVSYAQNSSSLTTIDLHSTNITNSGSFNNAGALANTGTFSSNDRVALNGAPLPSFYGLALQGEAATTAADPIQVDGLIKFTTRTGAAAWHMNLQKGALDFVESDVAANRLYLLPGGNIGIGTSAPAARLDVRGDIKLGAAGEFYTTSSSENLRIIRGLVKGSSPVGSLVGSGYSVVRVPGEATGTYRVNFPNPFADICTVTATAVTDPAGVARIATISGYGNNFFDVRIWTVGGVLVDSNFSFIATGPR